MKTHIFGRRETIADNAPIATCCRTCGKREECKIADDQSDCNLECNAECPEWVKQEDGK